MGSFHSAAFRLALETGTSLIPICMTGNEIVMPKGSSLLRPGTIRVRQLPPIEWEAVSSLTPFALKKRVWELMDRELAIMEGVV
jgi:1-acyl-sn-glycerol-3-phosphate acyltransferase